jgi:hypothetical protein
MTEQLERSDQPSPGRDRTLPSVAPGQVPQSAMRGQVPRSDRRGWAGVRNWFANWRKEMLYLTLAAMETSWFYPWLIFLVGTRRQPGIPIGAVFGTLVVALELTRVLNQESLSLLVQRVAVIVLALLSSLLLLKLYVYADYPATDVAWLRRFAWELGNFFQRIHPSFVIFGAGLYLWWRGIQIARGDLGVPSVSLSFRVGIVAFLWLFLVRVFSPRIDATPFAFVYFLLGLIALGLARIEEVTQSRLGIRSPFNASWMSILFGSALLVLALSVLTAWLFSVRNVTALVRLFSPIIPLLRRIASPLLVVLARLLDLLLVNLIRVFGAALGREFEALSEFSEELQQFQQLETEPAQGVVLIIIQLLKWGFLLVLLLGALAVLALSMSRVWLGQQAGRDAEHDSVWETGSAAKDVRDALGSRWRRWREELLVQLARLRGEEYSLITIRQIYASLVKLATASGFPRRQAETPYEYTVSLNAAFPGSGEEIQLITNAYVRTHYGERSLRPNDVQRVRDAWLTIRTRQEQGDRG